MVPGIGKPLYANRARCSHSNSSSPVDGPFLLLFDLYLQLWISLRDLCSTVLLLLLWSPETFLEKKLIPTKILLSRKFKLSKSNYFQQSWWVPFRSLKSMNFWFENKDMERGRGSLMCRKAGNGLYKLLLLSHLLFRIFSSPTWTSHKLKHQEHNQCWTPHFLNCILCALCKQVYLPHDIYIFMKHETKVRSRKEYFLLLLLMNMFLQNYIYPNVHFTHSCISINVANIISAKCSKVLHKMVH